jgi:hypothetical protein
LHGILNRRSSTPTGCHYKFTGTTTTNTTGANEDATVHILCDAGSKIIIGPTLGCKVEIGSQDRHGVHYNNIATVEADKMHLTLEMTLMNVEFSSSGCSSLLGIADGAHEGAEVKGSATLLGFGITGAKENTAVREGITIE